MNILDHEAFRAESDKLAALEAKRAALQANLAATKSEQDRILEAAEQLLRGESPILEGPTRETIVRDISILDIALQKQTRILANTRAAAGVELRRALVPQRAVLLANIDAALETVAAAVSDYNAFVRDARANGIPSGPPWLDAGFPLGPVETWRVGFAKTRFVHDPSAK